MARVDLIGVFRYDDKFEMNDLGLLYYFLGLEVKQGEATTMNMNEKLQQKDGTRQAKARSFRSLVGGPDSGSRYTRLSPRPSVSVLDGEIITKELGLLKISPKTNPRSFPYSVKQQCWDKAEKVKGRDPDRWHRDPLGNTIFRKLVGCPGFLCHDYDHIIPYSKQVLGISTYLFSTTVFLDFLCL
uniref:Uncharacterized protein n=1 Tax=Solanum lycopersicum TaxID=4081 RepID=A0A3Q7H6E8_SOLLC